MNVKRNTNNTSINTRRNTEFFLSQASVLPLPLEYSMKLAKGAGFDGIEIFNFQKFWRNEPNVCRRLAKKYHLGIHFHEVWSREKNDPHLHNRILDFIGALPHSKYFSEKEFGRVYEPAVLYANRWQYANTVSNYWLQTNDFKENGQYLVSFNNFCYVVKEYNLSVVFNTQHVLEFMLDKNDGVKSLPTEKNEILDLVEKAWGILGPHVKEIHLNDFRPPYHNVFLGDGVFPLNEFVEMVRDSGWSGTVIPEVDPRYLLGPSLKKRLLLLRQTAGGFF